MDLFDLVAKITLDTREYERGLGDSEEKAKNFGSKLKGGLATAGKIAAAGLAAATTATVGFGAKAVEAGKNFDSSMSQVAATMGLTMDEIENEVGATSTSFGEFSGTLREFAQYMGSNTAFSATQAADALNYMALAGYDAQTSMDMLPNVLNLAAAGGMDLATASDMVTDASSALGLSIEETAVMVDQMAKSSSKSNTSVAQLGEAFLTVGGTAKNLTGGTNELATALGILADNGIKGSEGGTALRNILLSLTPKSEDAAAAMKQIGFEAYDADGNMRPLVDIFSDMNAAMADMSTQEKQNTLSAIFNKVDLKSVSALMSAANDEFTNLYAQLNDYSVLEQEINGLADPFGALGISASELKKQLQEATTQEEFTKNMTEKFGMSAEQAAYTWGKMRDVAQESGTRFDELSGYIKDASGAAAEMAETQLDNLAGDITLFQSAMEGAQIVLSDKLSPTLREFVQFGSSAISTLSTAFKDGGLSGAMDALGTLLSDGIALIIGKLPVLVNAGMQLLSAFVKGITNNLPQLADATIDIIFTIADGIIDSLPELIPAIVNVIMTIAKKLTEPTMLMHLIQAAVMLISALARGLVDAIPQLLSQLPTIIINIVEALARLAPQLIVSGIQLMTQLAIGLVDGVFSVIESVVMVFNNIREAFHARIESAKEWGRDLIGNFIDGIVSKAKDLWGTIKNIGQGIKNLIGFSEPKEGPLSNFHTYAPDMMQLFAKGVKDNTRLVEDQVKDAFDFGGVIQNNNVVTGNGKNLSGTGGGITINVYPSQGMDEEELADFVMRKIQDAVERRSASLG